MGGGPKDREEEGREEGVAVVIGGGGKVSYQPCRIVVHLILLSSGLGGASLLF